MSNWIQADIEISCPSPQSSSLPDWCIYSSESLIATLSTICLYAILVTNKLLWGSIFLYDCLVMCSSLLLFIDAYLVRMRGEEFLYPNIEKSVRC